jgi:hypothetical protein
MIRFSVLVTVALRRAWKTYEDTDAAITPANADMHSVSGHRRDALHQMR